MPSWLFLVYFEPKKAILAKHFQISLNLVLLNKLFFIILSHIFIDLKHVTI